ncbi:cytochrome P450 4C1-like isoform X2 [Schistocerca piceifrons]|uniref:cytochrome P450 4C1-like isoform X2 n=1 Tax=Schistocerca piceifrons TaxID=274613 RepID=UPI001F5E677E|nr:cytochrome P450 4C1-like isoform X2 [Schistocerca piceifrons]
MELILFVGAAAVVGLAALALYRRWTFCRAVDKIPGPLAFPLIGTTYIAFLVERQDRLRVFDKVTKQYWPIFRGWMGPSASINVSKPEHIEKILASSELISKAANYRFLFPWLGEGLLTSAETAMGTSVNAQNETGSEYVSAVYNISALTIKRIVRPWIHSDFIFRRTSTGREYYKHLDVIHSFTKKVIRQRQLSRKLKEGVTKDALVDDIGRKRRLAFLDLLLDASENGQKLCDQEIQEEVDTFMFEGHDTTSVAMCWALLLLGHHQNVQDKVYSELHDIFGHDKDRLPTLQDLNSMKYLEMVIKETLRLYPSVPFIGRKVTKNIEIGGYAVPEGAMLNLHIYHAHRDPDHWPDPDSFDPDNFLPERVQGRHPYAYVPFSAGPRNCIGQRFAILEEKTVLSQILRNYHVQTLDTPEHTKVAIELILKPVEGIVVRLTPR